MATAPLSACRAPSPTWRACRAPSSAWRAWRACRASWAAWRASSPRRAPWSACRSSSACRHRRPPGGPGGPAGHRWPPPPIATEPPARSPAPITLAASFVGDLKIAAGGLSALAGAKTSGCEPPPSGSLFLAVHDRFQRTGIGGALLRTLIASAERFYRLERLGLVVVCKNDVAIKMYQKGIIYLTPC